MCEFFVKADPILYESRTRTVRIHGVLTSIRLENLVWDTLAEMAHDESCTTNALIAQFHDEILLHRGDVANFSSFSGAPPVAKAPVVALKAARH
jgi:predicted DNA-binding ribbon-helix-helix protein